MSEKTMICYVTACNNAAPTSEGEGRKELHS